MISKTDFYCDIVKSDLCFICIRVFDLWPCKKMLNLYLAEEENGWKYTGWTVHSLLHREMDLPSGPGGVFPLLGQAVCVLGILYV